MSSREPFTKSDDDHLVQYLATHHPMVNGRLGQKVYMNLAEMTGNDYTWTKRHSWQSWRERYKKNEYRMHARISALLKANRKLTANEKNELDMDVNLEVPVVKKEVNKQVKRVDGGVKEAVGPKVEEKGKDHGKRKSQTVTASQSAKTSQELPSSSLTMPPPAQRPMRTPLSTMDSAANALSIPTPDNNRIASDSYDHELFGSQQKDAYTDDGTYHDLGSTYSSDEEDEVAHTTTAGRRTTEKQMQNRGQNGDTPQAPPAAQPQPSQSQVFKSRLTNKKRAPKQDEEDIFTDVSPNSTPGPPRRPPPPVIVRVEQGAFRRTIKRPRESAGDSNWPPKRQKNANKNVIAVQQQEQEQLNGKANDLRQQLKVLSGKPRQAPPAVASSSRTRLEDMLPPPPPPLRLASPSSHRPEANSKTYAMRKSDESHQVFRGAHISDNEAPGRTRTSDPLPRSTTTHHSESKPPKLDFKVIRKSRRSLVDNGTSSRASNISSRSSVTSRSHQPSRRPSLEFQVPHLPHQTRSSRPRPSAIELASTQDANLFAELGLHHALTLIAQEYGFNIDFTRAIYEQTRDLEYTKFMLKRFQEAVRVEADLLVERFPVLLWENREEAGSQMEMPGVEEFVVSDEEEGDGRGKGKAKAITRKERGRDNIHTCPSTPWNSKPSSPGSFQKKSSLSRSRPRSSQTLASVIRPLSPGELSLSRDDISDYEPPGKSRAGTFVRLERRGLIDEAIELEKRRVSGQYEKKRKSFVDEETLEKRRRDEQEDMMDVDQEQGEVQYMRQEEQVCEEEEKEYLVAQDDEEGEERQEQVVELLEDDEQEEQEGREADADDEHENGDDDQEGSIVSQHESDVQEVDELAEDPLADDDEDYSEGNKDFEGLFTQINPGEGGQDELDVDDDDDMYVSQELQAPLPAAEEGENGGPTPLAVKMEPIDAEVGVEPQSSRSSPHAQPAQNNHRTEHENNNENEPEVETDEEMALAFEHFSELIQQVTEDNCEEMKKFEEILNEYDGDLLKESSLEWATARLARFI